MSAISQYQQQQCARSSTFSPVTPDMRDFQCSTPLKTDVSRPFQKLINENAFDRLSVRRCSLTKKFMSTNEQTEVFTFFFICCFFNSKNRPYFQNFHILICLAMV